MYLSWISNAVIKQLPTQHLTCLQTWTLVFLQEQRGLWSPPPLTPPLCCFYQSPHLQRIGKRTNYMCYSCDSQRESVILFSSCLDLVVHADKFSVSTIFLAVFSEWDEFRLFWSAFIMALLQFYLTAALNSCQVFPGRQEFGEASRCTMGLICWSVSGHRAPRMQHLFMSGTGTQVNWNGTDIQFLDVWHRFAKHEVHGSLCNYLSLKQSV